MSLNVCGLCPLLEVYDMPRSIAFYCDKLGFNPRRARAGASASTSISLGPAAP